MGLEKLSRYSRNSQADFASPASGASGSQDEFQGRLCQQEGATATFSKIRLRRFTHKVRSGCKNCKERRIKCDEAKPDCLRCIKRGLTCAGAHAPQPLLFDHHGSWEERRRLQFFTQCSIPVLQYNNQADRDLWTYIMPQASYSRSAVRHALIAFSSWHQSLVDPANSADHQVYAQLQYFKALKAAGTATYKDANLGLADMIVMSVALRMVEAIRHDCNAAMVHVEAGRSLLKAARERQVGDHVIDLFAQGSGQELQSPITILQEIPVRDITEVRQAHLQFEQLQSWLGLHLARPQVFEVLSMQEQIEDILTKLYNRLGSLAAAENSPIHLRQDTIWLRIRCLLVKMTLQALPSSRFGQAPAFSTDSLTKLLDLCESHVSYDTASLLISCGAELNSTVFFIATVCHDMRVRERAISFLQRRKRQEPHWHSHHAALVSQWVLQQEQSILTKLQIQKLSVYHDDAQRLDLDDAKDRVTISFGNPKWVRVKYSTTANQEQVHYEWLDLQTGASQKPLRIPSLVLAYELKEPLVPSSVAMLIRAYGSGMATLENLRLGAGSCDANDKDTDDILASRAPAKCIDAMRPMAVLVAG